VGWLRKPGTDKMLVEVLYYQSENIPIAVEIVSLVVCFLKSMVVSFVIKMFYNHR
jgi:hypothetical protein